MIRKWADQSSAGTSIVIAEDQWRTRRQLCGGDRHRRARDRTTGPDAAGLPHRGRAGTRARELTTPPRTARRPDPPHPPIAVSAGAAEQRAPATDWSLRLPLD